MTDKELLNQKQSDLLRIVTKFCDEKLNDEYKELCIKLVEKMGRKRTVPFLSGRLEIWASAVIYALGQINFLFDKSFKPYQSADDICGYFGTTKSSVGQKAKIIRDMFKLNYFDAEFSVKSMKESNPFNNLMMINGFIVNK